MQITVSYALKCDPSEFYLLTEGSQKYSRRPQICLLGKREIPPAFLDQYCLLDTRNTKVKNRLTKFGEHVFSSQSVSKTDYVAKVDTQIEFTCSAEVLEAIHSIAMPAIHHIASIGYFSDEITGFISMLRVYMIDPRIDDTLLSKGREGSSGIIRLYDQFGQETTVDVSLGEPVISSGVFEQLREEIIHVLRTKGALVGTYNNDDKGKALLREVGDVRRILQPKRDYDLDSADDHAQTDYIKLYDSILNLYPNMSGIISYIKDVRPAQFGEIPALVFDAKAGEKEAYNRLIDVHMRSILRHAYYYHQRYGLDIEDLFQEGIFGLQIAIPRYSEQIGAAFGAYSAMWVRQNILRRVVYHYGVVYVPVHAMEKIIQSKGIVSQHICAKCKYDACSVLNKEIMALLDCNEAAAELIIALCLPAVSYDEIDINDEMGVAEYSYILDHEFRDAKINIASESSDPLFDRVVNFELRETLWSSLDELTAREARVISQRYGLEGPARTLEEIGKSQHVTRERVRQIQIKGERKLVHSKPLLDWLGLANQNIRKKKMKREKSVSP